MNPLAHPAGREDWSDCHDGPVRAEITTARQAYEQALAGMPAWVHGAMALRNRIVGLFGLAKAAGAEEMAALPIITDTADTFETGLVDRHLTFTVEVCHHGDHVAATTRIWFNHWTGRLYLVAVLIPHRIIMKAALRSLK